MNEDMIIDADICEKLEDWDEGDIGKIIPLRITANGTYRNEMIVEVFCQFCGAEFIGPSREAGGFIGGHECLHAWQVRKDLGREDGLVE